MTDHLPTPSMIVYQLAGSPAVPEANQPGRCAFCAREVERAIPYARWQGANFVDQTVLADAAGSHVCSACVWATSWVAPPGYVPPPNRPKKEGGKGVMLRLFSHLWDEDRGYIYATKADKPFIRTWLRSRHERAWFAALADSGKKHVLPFAPMNPRGALPGVVRFEERSITLGDWELVDAMTEILTKGASKAEVATGQYSLRRWEEIESSLVAFERVAAFRRGSGWFALALWLAQKVE